MGLIADADLELAGEDDDPRRRRAPTDRQLRRQRLGRNDVPALLLQAEESRDHVIAAFPEANAEAEAEAEAEWFPGNRTCPRGLLT